MEVTHHELAYPLLNTRITHINRKFEIYDVFLGFFKRILIFFQPCYASFVMAPFRFRCFPGKQKSNLFAKKTSNILEQNQGKIN